MSAEDSSPKAPADPDDFDEFELALKQRRKRNLIIAGAGAAVILGGLAIFLIVFYANQPDPRCDKKVARDFLKAKDAPGVAVGRVCRFPEKMDQALRDMTGSAPNDRVIYAAKLLADEPSLFTPVCSGIRKKVGQIIGDHPPGEQSAALAKVCDLNVIAPKGAWTGVPFYRALMAVAIYATLNKSDSTLARPLANAMLTRAERDPSDDLPR